MAHNAKYWEKCAAHFARSCFSFVLFFPFLSPVCPPWTFLQVHTYVHIYFLFILDGLVCQFASPSACQSVSFPAVFIVFFPRSDATFQLFLQVFTFVLFHFLWTWKCLGRGKKTTISFVVRTFKAIYVLKKNTYIYCSNGPKTLDIWDTNIGCFGKQLVTFSLFGERPLPAADF